jgi:predicted protein tyrosine phosphatase
MPRVHVCPLSLISETVAETGASHLVSLINGDTHVPRPAAIAAQNHLFLGINDIVEPMEGMVLPAESHVERLVAFAGAWDRQRPMVVHCFAGISRSTAGAFIVLCALSPEREERAIARALRAASAHATPNRRLVGLADDLLGRRGRMVTAVDAIGIGANAYEGVPFGLALAG